MHARGRNKTRAAHLEHEGARAEAVLVVVVDAAPVGINAPALPAATHRQSMPSILTPAANGCANN